MDMWKGDEREGFQSTRKILGRACKFTMKSTTKISQRREIVAIGSWARFEGEESPGSAATRRETTDNF